MPIFRRNSTTASLLESKEVREPSKLRKGKGKMEGSSGSWTTRFRRKGSVDVGNTSERRGSTDSDSSCLSSSSSANSSATLFDSPRTSISSSSISIRRLATSSTPSLQITPPSPQLNGIENEVSSDDRSGIWPFSTSSSSPDAYDSSSSSYASSLFSLSSASLSSSLDRNDISSMQNSSPSLFLSYLLKYSFPEVPPRSGMTAELMSVRQLSEEGVRGEREREAGDGELREEGKPRRLIDYYLDSSLRS
ncbi:hypothetical protein JCM5350_002486 [Sporobolomyces pararoseus]